MYRCLRLVAMFALACLCASAAHAQPLARAAPAVNAEDDPRIQQYVQLLQPALWKELDFVRQVCELTPQQRPKIKAAGDAAVKEAAKAIVLPPRQPRSSPRRCAMFDARCRQKLPRTNASSLN